MRRPGIKAFFDTSALIKRYIEEPGSVRVAELFNEATEVWVAPSSRIETYHVLYRLKHAYPAKAKDLYYLMREIDQDFQSFSMIPWNTALENKVVEVMEKSPIKSFDAVQLASALLVSPDMFILADKQLAATARKCRLTTELIV